MQIKYSRRVLVAAAVGLFVIAEATVRMSGLVDFPVYDKDSEIGYILKPNQSGSFLNKNRWIVNDRSMGVATPWSPVSDKTNLLLIGNSIVMGGNPYDQSEKIGPLIQAQLGEHIAVWPIAAGGWSTVNESVYLHRNPDVAEASNFFVWEYMNGGFSQLSPDRGEYVFPTEKPALASWYVLRRYVLPKLIPFNMNELPPTGASAQGNVQQFESQVAKLAAGKTGKKAGLLFFYPGRDEYLGMQKGVDYVPDRAQLERIAAKHKLVIVDIGKHPEWNLQMYREGTHPTVEGNQVLASILATAIREAM